MSHNNESLIDKNNNSNIEPFDKIEQGNKKYIPNIPSVISDMKKNNIYLNNINNDDNLNKNTNENNTNEIIESNEEEKIKNNYLEEPKKNINNNKDFSNIVCDYWNTFRNNETVSTIINPFQDDGECVNKVYKIYSCITLTLILIVIILSITLS